MKAPSRIGSVLGIIALALLALKWRKPMEQIEDNYGYIYKSDYIYLFWK